MNDLDWPAAPVKARRGIDSRINLSSNELHHPATSALVTRLVEGFLPDALTAYPVQREPVEAVARLFGHEPGNVMLVPGSDAAIRLLLGTTGDQLPGGILLQAPNYETWTQATESARWRITEVPSPDGTGEGSLAALGEAARRAVRRSLVVLSWPNGPAGYVPAFSEVSRLRDICRETGHLLLVDGCYAGFAGDPHQVAALADDGCVVLLSWSKLFGVAGGRLGACFGGARLIEHLRASRVEDHVNALMLHAASRTSLVYDDFAAVWQDVAARRERLRVWLCASGIAVPVSGTNFLHVPMPDAESAARLTGALSDDGFRTRDMGAVTGLRNHVRFTVACGPVGEVFAPVLAKRLHELGVGEPDVLHGGPDAHARR